MTEIEKLLPCPFCGDNRASTYYVRDGRVAMCRSCGARSGDQFNGPLDLPTADERAIAAWNTRASDAALLVAEKALRELSFLGNGDRPGNSDGNMIARAALSEIEKLTGGGE